MHSNTFVKIDENFLIKKNLTNKKFNECISFISKQIGCKSDELKSIYNKDEIHVPKISKKLNDMDIHIILKRKYNKNYKFINFNKSLIFYEYSKNSDLDFNKINEYKLSDIEFFPLTYLSNDLIFQQLAKGIIYRPNNLFNFDSALLDNVSMVIERLSSKKKHNIDTDKFLKNFDFSNYQDPLNTKILDYFKSSLKKSKNKKIHMSLTHGDFKLEHLFVLNNSLEFVIDWENVGLRSVLFDLINFFTPWFVKRSYKYYEIKNFIQKFVKIYLPKLLALVEDNYDYYFSIYALERYKRIKDKKINNFSIEAAYKRYNLLFKNLL